MWKLIVFFGCVLLLAACSPPASDGGPTPGATAYVWTDAVTGCDYLKGSSGALSPRRERDGSLYCRAQGSAPTKPLPIQADPYGPNLEGLTQP